MVVGPVVQHYKEKVGPRACAPRFFVPTRPTDKTLDLIILSAVSSGKHHRHLAVNAAVIAMASSSSKPDGR